MKQAKDAQSVGDGYITPKGTAAQAPFRNVHHTVAKKKKRLKRLTAYPLPKQNRMSAFHANHLEFLSVLFPSLM